MTRESSSKPLAGREEAGRKPFTAVVVDARGPDEAESLARARATLRRWRRTGLPVAVVCSRSGAHALTDHDLFEVVLDESRHGRPAMESTVRLLGEATLRMDAAPLDTLVVAHAVISVAAAQALGFRRIVGVEREGDAPGLIEAGARSVVDDLRGLRFPRLLPSGLQCQEEISRWRAGRDLAVFLDYDGTLTPIVSHPAEAWLEPDMRQTVAAVARRFPVAVLSGRDRTDLSARIALSGVYYAGGHGMDLEGPGIRYTPPGTEAWVPCLKTAAESVERALRDVPGVTIERKRFSVGVHYRQADPAESERILEGVSRAADTSGLQVRRGKQVREMVPDMGWHKGRAVDWLSNALDLDPARTCLVYIGDDETDEDAFQALGPEGIGLRPGTRVAASLADYHLTDVNAVREFLEWLAADSWVASGAASS